jgi:hypothetical protein
MRLPNVQARGRNQKVFTAISAAEFACVPHHGETRDTTQSNETPAENIHFLGGLGTKTYFAQISAIGSTKGN